VVGRGGERGESSRRQPFRRLPSSSGDDDGVAHAEARLGEKAHVACCPLLGVPLAWLQPTGLAPLACGPYSLASWGQAVHFLTESFAPNLQPRTSSTKNLQSPANPSAPPEASRAPSKARPLRTGPKRSTRRTVERPAVPAARANGLARRRLNGPSHKDRQRVRSMHCRAFPFFFFFFFFLFFLEEKNRCPSITLAPLKWGHPDKLVSLSGFPLWGKQGWG